MQQRILNCVKSTRTDTDWTFERALGLGLSDSKAPPSLDLRENWWVIKEQGETGACVGYAVAGLLKWHFVKNGLIEKEQELSARFIWMANKEMDELTKFPTTFLEKAGTQTKLALQIAQKFGCVLEELLPMEGPLSALDTATFYSIAAKLRVKSYHALGTNFNYWRRWLTNSGPLLARVNVDNKWLDLDSKGVLNHHVSTDDNIGHAICIVGYTPKYFIIRNSWGTGWGDLGYAYAGENYARSALSDVYGVLV